MPKQSNEGETAFLSNTDRTVRQQITGGTQPYCPSMRLYFVVTRAFTLLLANLQLSTVQAKLLG